MTAVLAPILVFGLVIFVHELGHFLAAKAVGVYAPRFSIGFGPAIIRFRRGETEYVLACLPLGGFVRMASRHDGETAFIEGGAEEGTTKREGEKGYDPNAMIPFGPKPVPEHRWFESKSLGARVVIMIAGIVMNIVLAFVVFTGIVLYHGDLVLPSTRVGGIHVVAGAPGLAALKVGDSVVAINGAPVLTFNDELRAIRASRDSVRITTQSGTVAVPLKNSNSADSVADALDYYVTPVIQTVLDGSPAASAGLQKGDSIVAINGSPITSWTAMVEVVSASPKKPVVFLVSRAGGLDTISVTPNAVLDTNPETQQERTVGRVGVGAGPVPQKHPIAFGAAVQRGGAATWEGAFKVVQTLRQIGTGEQSVRQLGGPIAITRAAVTEARAGWDRLFELIALLSVNVAVLNLLPIPILDGGQILINVLETVKGGPFSIRAREYILRVGLAAIAMLFVIVMYNDTRAGFVKLFGWVGSLFGA